VSETRRARAFNFIVFERIIPIMEKHHVAKGILTFAVVTAVGAGSALLIKSPPYLLEDPHPRHEQHQQIDRGRYNFTITASGRTVSGSTSINSGYGIFYVHS
jgi:hypothetical protein